MSLYLFQAAYTPESWKYQIEKRQDPKARINPMVESLGGHIVGAFYAFGEHDIVVLVEMPDDEAAAAFALAAGAGGSLSSIKTTKLLTVEQGLDAMQKASEAGKKYAPPIPQGTVRETVTR